jgi:hypothetical protein
MTCGGKDLDMSEYVELYRMQKANKAEMDAIAAAIANGATEEEAAAAGKEAHEASELSSDPVADEKYLRTINAHLLPPDQIPLAGEASWAQYKDLNSLYGASGKYLTPSPSFSSRRRGRRGTCLVRGGDCNRGAAAPRGAAHCLGPKKQTQDRDKTRHPPARHCPRRGAVLVACPPV